MPNTITRTLNLCLAAGALLLAACGGEPPSSQSADGDADLFLRDVPDPPPEDGDDGLEPISTSSEVSDQDALARACTEFGRSSADACACMAETAARRLDGRAYAYFAARARGDAATASELESGMTLGEMAEAAGEAARIALECGGASG